MSEKKTNRIQSLDFNKGVLVMTMVLYHWLNYFLGTGHGWYRYLRFLTPAFIFITGFMISHLNFSGIRPVGRDVARRLFRRGMRLFVLFLSLNLVISILAGLQGVGLGNWINPSELVRILLIGNVLSPRGGKLVSFYILLPISYLLMTAAGVVFLSLTSRASAWAITGGALASIWFLHTLRVESPNLELVTVGLLGASFGYAKLESYNLTRSQTVLLVVGYASYLAAIAEWDVKFPLQLVGVCLSLLLLHVMSIELCVESLTNKIIVLLGVYSLFAYIAQIAILQMVRRVAFHLTADNGVLVGTLVTAIGLMIGAVLLLDWARARSRVVGRLYSFVFG